MTMAPRHIFTFSAKFSSSTGSEENIMCHLIFMRLINGSIPEITAGFWQGVGAGLPADSLRLVCVDGRAAGHSERCQCRRVLAGHLDWSCFFRCRPCLLPLSVYELSLDYIYTSMTAQSQGPCFLLISVLKPKHMSRWALLLEPTQSCRAC